MTNKLPDPLSTSRAGGVLISKTKTIEEYRGNACDCNHWGKMATWALPQAHFLVLGYEPPDNDLQEHQRLMKALKAKNNPNFKGIIGLWELIENAYYAKTLAFNVYPVDFLEWAKTHDIDFPQELYDTVKKYEQKRLGTEQPQDESPLSLTEMEYIPPYLNLMLEAVKALKLNPKKRILAQEINSWLSDHWPADLEGKSDRIIENMVTLLRRPQDKKGGNIAFEKD